MIEKEITGLRGVLEQMSTEQLDEMLQEELKKEPIDDHAIRMILKVLRQREMKHPAEPTQKMAEIWEEYQKRMEEMPDFEEKKVRKWNWAAKAASFGLAAALLFALIPQTAQAESLLEMLTRWTDTIFEIFSPGDTVQAEYEFKTDHPGLQEVYDAVTELGVRVSVVPSWLMDSYELIECKVIDTSRKTGVAAYFADGESEMVLKIDIFNSDVSHKYPKDSTVVEQYEKGGVIHYIMRNNENWVVIWSRDNLECSLSIDCQEDTLHEILRSIYVMEDT